MSVTLSIDLGFQRVAGGEELVCDRCEEFDEIDK